MKISKKFLVNTIAIGGLATAGALATATVSFAATTTDTNTNLITRVAQILGIDSTKVTDAVKQAETEKIDKMVTDGKITQEQADKMKENVANGELRGFGMGGPGGMHGMGKINLFSNAATFLGITEDELKTALDGGQKLSDITTSKGKTVADLKTYLTQKESDQLAQDVKDGKITQTQADEMKTRSSEMLDNFINGTMPKFNGRGPRSEQSNTNSTDSTVTQ